MKFDDMLKTLQREYLASLPEKIICIRNQVETAAASGELRDSFHKLKGTGRTYGLPEVSELAEVVENVCVNRPELSASVAGAALPILRDIHSARSGSLPFNLQNDPRFTQIQRLLVA